MDRNTLLCFFNTLMRNFHLHTHCFSLDSIPEFDQGLRRMVGWKESSLPMMDQFIRPNCIYRILDAFGCRYFSLRLPGEDTLLLAGPYLNNQTSEQFIVSWAEAHKVSNVMLPALRRYYNSLPMVDDDAPLLVIMSTLGEMLWGSQEAFSFENYESPGIVEGAAPTGSVSRMGREDVDICVVEARYEGEARLMHAVSQGMVHQASMMLSGFHPANVEHRTMDSLRNLKNYAIVLNVLLRKAAQQGNVHPLYIDQLSSTLAHQIEKLLTVQEGQRFLQTMVHKYCLLVKNHTMRGYSQPVQSVILRVDADLTANLSLQAHATHLGINASYLSSLFKRETGLTLTEYVNRKRIDNAIFLLNTTSMQVQTIAQHCGIPDVNYFTKTFKRMIGQTPTEYRLTTRGLNRE